jgi:hypothetical protein
LEHGSARKRVGAERLKAHYRLLLAEQGFLLLYQRPIEFGPEAG